ncbi:MAG: DoxX family protein [Rubrobacteraceae bacterium]
MEVIATVLQVILGLAFLGAGGSKLAGTQQMVEMFDHFRYPRWFMYFTGSVEIVGALGVLVGIFAPVLAVLGGLLLAATMVGAVFTHIRSKDPVSMMIPPGILLVLSIAVIVSI